MNNLRKKRELEKMELFSKHYGTNSIESQLKDLSWDSLINIMNKWFEKHPSLKEK